MDLTTGNDKEVATSSSTFKKPILIGKLGRLPRQLKASVIVKTKQQQPEEQQVDGLITESLNDKCEVDDNPKQQVVENNNTTSSLLPPYIEPKWSGLPVSSQSSKDYVFEVLKNGSIIDRINLMSKSFWMFGRIPSCDISMQHPTISRFHAVLQYNRNEANDDTFIRGFYLYDLNSTHGTFLNKNRIKSKVYVRIQVGHMIKLGCSSRVYILTGPDDDAEEESLLTVTELKQKRLDTLKKREQDEAEAALNREKEMQKARERIELRGCDWGLGDDETEEEDGNENDGKIPEINPYAQTNNEELFLDNPKKALRGFFEREGLNFNYDCTEQGMGQFFCKVELPVDDDKGRPIFAEVLHKGKKKEAVQQCALEACRILDRFGLLRKAVHESRKRKPKNWEENDFYSSDDDTFLDRTGVIEKKREMRMKAKIPQKAATYETLMEQEKNISLSIKNVLNDITKAQIKLNSQERHQEEEDSLDSFMKELKNSSKVDKKYINRLKSDLVKLKQDHLDIVKLVNVARPTDLPPLVINYESINNEVGKSKSAPTTSSSLLCVKLETETSDEKEEAEDNLVLVNNPDQSEQRKDKPQTNEGNSTENVNLAMEGVSSSSSDQECKKKRNQRRIQQRQQNAEIQKRKGYETDATKEDYNMWVPPKDQLGDGKTKLNEKFGY